MSIESAIENRSNNSKDNITFVKELLDSWKKLNQENIEFIKQAIKELVEKTLEKTNKLLNYFNGVQRFKINNILPEPIFCNALWESPWKLDLLVGWAEAFEEIWDQIDAASESIHITMFIWRNDKTGRMLARKLLNAADRWVKISLEKDRLWNIFEKSEQSEKTLFHPGRPTIWEWFKTAFVDTAYSNVNESTGYDLKQDASDIFISLSTHQNVSLKTDVRNDHSKYRIFDGNTLITWWINVWDEYNEWIDYWVSVTC